MAVARLVCGDCGGALAPADARCPSCGASIEKESSSSVPVACGACGQMNQSGGEFCSSCGARLGSRPARRDAKLPKQPRAQQKPAAPQRFDPWQIVSVAAILALIGYGAYLLIDREKSPPSAPAASAPPTGGSPLADLKMESVDVSPLEDAVKANPGDAGARLKLANALEDTHRYDGAIAEYRTYLKLRPKDADARTDLGICYFQKALTDSVNRVTLLHDAATEMESAFNGASRSHQPSAFNLGIVYLHLNQVGDANLWFKKVVDIDPGSDLGKRAQNMLTQHNIPQ